MRSNLLPEHLPALEAFALELNAAAAAITLPLFRTLHAVEDKRGKGKFDPVTAADKGAEEALRRLIAARYPEHGVIGEEYGEDRPQAEFVWVLDPVDGTRSFVAGLPLWATLIGLRYQGEPVLGSVGQPYLQEIFVGSPHGSRLLRAGAETPLWVRACPRLAEATVSATDPHAYFTDAELAVWSHVRAGARNVRLGGDAYAFALVALGTVDLVVESALNPWDIDPIVPIIEGAGGLVTDWRGERLGRQGGQAVAAGDRACLEQAVEHLKGAVI